MRSSIRRVGTKRSSLRRRKERGRRSCAQFLSSGRSRSRLACGARRREGKAMVGRRTCRSVDGGRASATSSEPMAHVDELSSSVSPQVRRCHELSVRDGLLRYQVSRRRAHASVRNARGNAIVSCRDKPTQGRSSKFTAWKSAVNSLLFCAVLALWLCAVLALRLCVGLVDYCHQDIYI